jgi:hypothetical protein
MAPPLDFEALSLKVPHGSPGLFLGESYHPEKKADKKKKEKPKQQTDVNSEEGKYSV